MSAVDVARAIANPGHVSGKVVILRTARNETRLRLFVIQMKTFMRAVKRGASNVANASDNDFHKANRIGNAIDKLFVIFVLLGQVEEIEIPQFRMIHVGKAAVNQTANEVHCHGGMPVPFQQQFRIAAPGFRREFRVVNHVSAISGKRNAVARFPFFGTGFGVLTAKTSNADNFLLAAVGKNQTHLEQNLQLAGDLRAGAAGERLGAVAALQKKRFPFRRHGKLFFERFDFPRRYQRRKAFQLEQNLVQLCLILVWEPLFNVFCFPRIRSPVFHDIVFPNWGGRGSRRQSAVSYKYILYIIY